MDDNSSAAAAGPMAPARRIFAGDTPSQRAKLIDSAARELGRSWNEVAPVYDQMYDQMARSAKIVDFLPALILKNLRIHFRRIAD